MRVRFTPTGRAQFLATVAYIRRENPTAAVRFRQRAEDALRRLERFPESGRVVPEFPDLPYREIIVSPYRFFYRIKDATVWVVAVWHGAQPPASLLCERASQNRGRSVLSCHLLRRTRPWPGVMCLASWSCGRLEPWRVL